MNIVAHCSKFIANSIKVYDIVRFQRFSVFVLFVNL